MSICATLCKNSHNIREGNNVNQIRHPGDDVEVVLSMHLYGFYSLNTGLTGGMTLWDICVENYPIF